MKEPLDDGHLSAPVFRTTGIKARARLAATLAALAIAAMHAPHATADAVTDWNEVMVTAGYASGAGNNAHTRNMAIAHLAMFEALNSIERRYQPYRKMLPAEPNASREAAVSAAAYYALTRVFPAQTKEFDRTLQATLGAVPDGPAKSSGVRLGEQAAAEMLKERSDDGAGAPNNYRPFTVAGKYVPTVLPISPAWAGVKPFAMKSGAAFRPGAPYALTSAEWAKEYDEVKRMGAKTGSARTAEQTEVAQFWAMTGPATYNPVARQLSAAKGLDMLDNARLFALVSMATADGAIAMIDAKYEYGFWRPVTAIRNGDIDGNDRTERDPNWEPLIPTPLHPEYPCAHCTFQGAAAAVLQSMFGDSVPRVSLTSTSAPGVTRHFVRLSDYVKEVIDARIYDGVHYRTSGEVGAAMGRRIGEHTVENYLKPLR